MERREANGQSTNWNYIHNYYNGRTQTATRMEDGRAGQSRAGQGRAGQRGGDVRVGQRVSGSRRGRRQECGMRLSAATIWSLK